MPLEQALAFIGATTAAITFAVAGVDWLIRKWLQKHRDELILALHAQVAALNENVSERTKERDTAREELKEVEADRNAKASLLVVTKHEVASLKEVVQSKSDELAELKEVKESLDKTQQTHDNRIHRALKLEGAIWTQPVMSDTTPFRSLAERRTPIISVLNLKGGVGKTTLTAHLAWALSARGYRVLLVDLDLQGSLSSLFLRNDELAKLGKAGTLLQHFLASTTKKGEGRPKRKLLDFSVPVPQLDKHCRLIAASDKLAYAELSQSVRWLLRVGGTAHNWSGRRDGRMILRRALHAKGLYKKFDVILLDCPPLINLCCANALAASDSILIPVTPSLKAIERVTPLLRRVTEIHENGVNPKLGVLGLVVNRTDGRELSPREQDLFVTLPDECISTFGSDVHRFDTIIQQRVAIQASEDYFEPPAEDHPLRTTFEALAEEFVKKLPKECRKPTERMQKKGSQSKGGGL
jgi:cellulose biosynthesis protein BcsQ